MLEYYVLYLGCSGSHRRKKRFFYFLNKRVFNFKKNFFATFFSE